MSIDNITVPLSSFLFTDNLSEDDNQILQDTAKNIFNKINVDNEGNSKDKLDLREVMNFFFTMDAANEEYAIAMRKDEVELLQKVNEALKKIKENGTYDEIIDKYLNHNIRDIIHDRFQSCRNSDPEH